MLLPDAPLPVTVLTGFLGAGKTTLLAHWLDDPAMGDAAVLVNEFGEVGIDHLLLEEGARDVVLLKNGCLCCALRQDLIDEVRGLFERRARGEIQPFARLFIETTGIADPVPILTSFLADPVLSSHFVPPEIVTVVDAVQGDRWLRDQAVALRQVACADALVLSKVDQVDAERTRYLERWLSAISPAPVLRTCADAALSLQPVLDALAGKDATGSAVATEAGHRTALHKGPRVFTFESPDCVESGQLNRWLSSLLRNHGDRLLRFKGIVSLADQDRTILIQAVGHAFDPPRPMPGAGQGARLVVILDDATNQIESQDLFASLAG